MSHLVIKYFWTEEMGILKITADVFLMLAKLCKEMQIIQL